MKVARTLIILLIAAGLVYVLNTRVAQVPPLGKFLDPFNGFWQNAEPEMDIGPDELELAGMKEEVDIFYDDRMVPHIFANNSHDAYFAKGYTEASERLFQMEFITRLASGRLSEVLGANTLSVDRYFRRLGLPIAAEKAHQNMMQNERMKKALQAYAAGVNAYIDQLDYKHYPIEYKMLDFEPSPWKTINSAYLLKLLSYNLTGNDDDFEMTNALRFYGDSLFRDIYPDFPDSLDPIVPTGTEFPEDTFSIPPPQDYVPTDLIRQRKAMMPNANNGSNNWAVAGWKTESGKPMLANDPHLNMWLPSLWYEVQLSTPEMNVYGATLPGNPGVIIGFNDHIAWGVTNAQRDVKDWYKVQLNGNKTRYHYDGGERSVETTVEAITIRGGKTYYDTIRHTHFGPIVYDNQFMGDSNKVNYALRWKAHDQSNELRTFLELATARHYNDYYEALRHFEVPAQNFAFAGKDSNIAIWQQGEFPMKWERQGKFLLDAANPAHQWQGTIPRSHNPHSVNPDRGFVSSANQHPTDSTYPYYYNGSFEYFRNRRINNVLGQADSHSITPESFQQLQTDNKSLYANAMLEVALPILRERSWSSEGLEWLEKLESWDYFYEAGSEEAVFYEIFWEHYLNLIMEKAHTNNIALPEPDDYVIIALSDSQPGHRLFDVDSTAVEESAHNLMVQSFSSAIKKIDKWKQKNDQPLTWANYKNTTLRHWLRVVDAFNVSNLEVGGNGSIVNATGKHHGPSWRMIVSLEDTTKAWVVYPGGQSGNPGSPHYNDFVDEWAAGEYFEAKFLQEKPEVSNPDFHLQKMRKP